MYICSNSKKVVHGPFKTIQNYVNNKIKSLKAGSIENAGYPNGLPNWGTYLGTPKKYIYILRSLTMLLWLSIIRPIDNRNCQK